MLRTENGVKCQKLWASCGYKAFLFYFTVLGPVCKEAVDLAFILDESGSIVDRNWEIMKEFTETLVRSFDISDQGTRVAALMFSNDPEVLIRFNEFTGPNNNADSVSRKIRSFGRSGIGGQTFINKALDLANSDLFTVANGMRGPEIKKVGDYCFLNVLSPVNAKEIFDCSLFLFVCFYFFSSPKYETNS